MKAKLTALLMAFLLCSTGLSAQEATEIIREMDQKMQGSSNVAEMTMKIIRPKWTREVGIKSWSKGTEKSLVLITAPQRDAGTAFLKRGNEMWNWQPTIDRVVKLPPSMMMQSWMGSDFTNDDLVKQSSIVEDYEHRLVGDTTLQGYSSHKIEMIPKENAAVVWGKVVVYVSKEEHLQLMSKFYDEDGYLINTMLGREVREIGGRTIPTEMHMIPADDPDQRTVITYENINFDVPIEDDFFSMQNMKRLR